MKSPGPGSFTGEFYQTIKENSPQYILKYFLHEETHPS